LHLSRPIALCSILAAVALLLLLPRLPLLLPPALMPFACSNAASALPPFESCLAALFSSAWVPLKAAA
jgi:hypothetical protein